MATVDPAQVREALIAAGITGRHRSHSRSSSIKKIHTLAAGEDVDATFGLSGIDRYGPGEILGFMAEIIGCPNDIEDVTSDDRIDPDKTIEGLVEAGRRLKASAERGDSMLVATGHPTGMLQFYIRVAEAYRRAGGKILQLREEEDLGIGKRGKHVEVRYIAGVGCVADWGNLRHTHSSDAMEALLESQPWPELVLGDHGFAGAAIERDIPTIAIMDINDHALAIARAQGRNVVIVPVDDNRPPRLYEPAWQLVEQLLMGASL